MADILGGVRSIWDPRMLHGHDSLLDPFLLLVEGKQVYLMSKLSQTLVFTS